MSALTGWRQDAKNTAIELVAPSPHSCMAATPRRLCDQSGSIWINLVQRGSPTQLAVGKNVFQLWYLGLDSLSARSGLWLGRLGWLSRRMRASWGVRPPFFVLQSRHEQTTFSQLVAPPRLRGITWSTLSLLTGSVKPQYWQL